MASSYWITRLTSTADFCLLPSDATQYVKVTSWIRLRAVFSDGVCHWSKPGVGQQTATNPLTFTTGPGGQPLPAAPVSQVR